ncbi:MAG: hypothetical protein ACOY46_11955 [Bacillota bacterium]
MFLKNMALIQQVFPGKSIDSTETETIRTLNAINLKDMLKHGSKVAITAGSRGIKDISIILKTLSGYISSCGCKPFILASMGSHGGGTVSGQLEILKELGITPEKIGAPVIASDISIPTSEYNGRSYYVNSLALEFEHVIIVNRIKPHTSFHGPYESGILKMIAMGLGGPKGASYIHSLGVQSLPDIIPEAASAIMKRLPITLGLAILEDAFKNTMLIKAITPDKFEETERELLEEARCNLPGLPFEDVDILIVDEIGKNFSGTGMDTNVIGRLRIQGLPEPAVPKIKRIVVLGVSQETKGNAYGIGLADFTTKRLVEGLDYNATYLNALTSTFVQRAMVPMTLPDDFSAIQAAVKSLGAMSPEDIRIVRIKNTLTLDNLLVSQPLLKEAYSNEKIKVVGQNLPLSFDINNQIIPF